MCHMFREIIWRRYSFGCNIKDIVVSRGEAQLTQLVKQFLNYVNDVIEKDILKELESCDTFALMFGQSTDGADMDQLALHA